MNEMSVYERLIDPLAAVKSLGLAIAKSRIFGCESEAQGEVLAWECLARRTPPLQLKETYHLINTSKGTALTMRADAMLAGFLQLGGRHRIIQRDADAAEVELSIGGQAQTFRCTFQDCEEAGITEGRDGTKDNWSSPRQRMQMLWARVVSDAVRAIAPQVCAGRYAPEDFGRRIEYDDATAALVVDGQATAYTVSEPAVSQPAAAAAPPTTPPPTPPAEHPTLQHPAPLPESTSITSEQKTRIRDLVAELDASAALEKALAKRGVNSINSLKFSDAAEIIGKLWDKACQRRADATAGASTLPPDARQAENAGPCTAAQVELAKQLVAELEQMQPGISKKIKAKLVAAGLSKISDLTLGDCERLLQQLGRRNIEEFLAASLAKPQPRTPGKN